MKKEKIKAIPLRKKSRNGPGVYPSLPKSGRWSRDNTSEKPIKSSSVKYNSSLKKSSKIPSITLKAPAPKHYGLGKSEVMNKVNQRTTQDHNIRPTIRKRARCIHQSKINSELLIRREWVFHKNSPLHVQIYLSLKFPIKMVFIKV